MNESCCSSQSRPLDDDSRCHDTTGPGYLVEKWRYEFRTRHIEEQVRGIDRMIEDEEYCTDVLIQISAVDSVLKSLALALLDAHLHHYMIHMAKSDQEESDVKLEEASAAIACLVRQLPEKLREWEGDVVKRNDETAVGSCFWLLIVWVVPGVSLKHLIFPGDWRILGEPGLLGGP